MSLLMDALRKAEEAKKKAEKAELGQGEQEQTGVEQLAGNETESALQAESAQPPAEESAVRSENEPEPPTLIPNVKIEFQHAEGDLQEQQTSAPGGEAGAEAATAASELRLEPIDPGLSQLSRQPFDQTATPDYSLEITGTSHSAKSGSDYNRPASPDTADSSSGKDEEELAGRSVASRAIADDTRASADRMGEDSLTDYAGRAAVKTPAKQQVQPAASMEMESRSRTARPDVATSRSKTAPNPYLRSSAGGSSVVARSAADRRSAKAVFAAKKQGKGSRFRIRRSTRIWAAQIAAAVILMAGGAYLYLSISGNSNSFNVPEEYLANQDVYSSEFNEELEAIEEAAVETEPSLDELAAVAEELLPDNIAIEDFPFTEPASGVAEEATEVTTEVTPVAANTATPVVTPTVDIADTALQQDQEPTTAEQLDRETLADAAPEVQQAPPVPAAPLASDSFRSSQQASAPISFSRAQTVNVIDPLLQEAYTAYQRDDLLRARELYQRVVSESPLQRDALLGLAAIATRNGETSLAMELYSRLLARDPSDGVARAGLLGLRPLGGPEAQERELRRLLEDHPQVAPVVYALGNFYAGQNRWNEAQRYYFNALQLAKTDALAGIPVNPDYAFNLAVSLERLRQATAAETYYREAIAFAADFPAGFDISIARNRLSRLTGSGS